MRDRGAAAVGCCAAAAPPPPRAIAAYVAGLPLRGAGMKSKRRSKRMSPPRPPRTEASASLAVARGAPKSHATRLRAGAASRSGSYSVVMSFTRTPCPSSGCRELGLGQAVGHVYRARAAGGVYPAQRAVAGPGRERPRPGCAVPSSATSFSSSLAEVGGGTGTRRSACCAGTKDKSTSLGMSARPVGHLTARVAPDPPS